MSREKGSPKTGGRQSGTPNKATSTIRGWLVELIQSNREQITADFQALEPKDRLVMIEKFMPYILPKVESAGEVEGAAYTKEDITERELMGYVEMGEKMKGLQKWYEK